MDMRLKERLIGATVLVLAAVLFIPMVLDGPDPNGRVSQTVPLPAPESEDERRTVRIDLAAQDTAPPQALAPSGAREPVSVDLVPQQEQAAESASSASSTMTASPTGPASPPVAQPEPESIPASASSEPEPASGTPDAPWTVQAGSFTQQDNAETLAAELRKLGFPAYVSRFDDGGRLHFRVRVGGYPSRDAAQSKADEIRDRTGEPARPVPAR